MFKLLILVGGQPMYVYKEANLFLDGFGVFKQD
jgi:hypothetical protein